MASAVPIPIEGTLTLSDTSLTTGNIGSANLDAGSNKYFVELKVQFDISLDASVDDDIEFYLASSSDSGTDIDSDDGDFDTDHNYMGVVAGSGDVSTTVKRTFQCGTGGYLKICLKHSGTAGTVTVNSVNYEGIRLEYTA